MYCTQHPGISQTTLMMDSFLRNTACNAVRSKTAFSGSPRPTPSTTAGGTRDRQHSKISPRHRKGSFICTLIPNNFAMPVWGLSPVDKTHPLNTHRLLRIGCLFVKAVTSQIPVFSHGRFRKARTSQRHLLGAASCILTASPQIDPGTMPPKPPPPPPPPTREDGPSALQEYNVNKNH